MGIPAELSQVARTLTYTGTGVGAQIGIGTTLNVSGGAYVSGSVGIGTINPTTTLQVNGTELIQSENEEKVLRKQDEILNPLKYFYDNPPTPWKIREDQESTINT